MRGRPWQQYAYWASLAAMLIAAAGFVSRGTSGVVVQERTKHFFEFYGIRRSFNLTGSQIAVSQSEWTLPASAGRGSAWFRVGADGRTQMVHRPQDQLVATFHDERAVNRAVWLDQPQRRLLVLDPDGAPLGPPIPLPEFGREGPVLRVHPVRWNKAGEVRLLCAAIYWIGLADPVTGVSEELPTATNGGLADLFVLQDEEGFYDGFVGLYTPKTPHALLRYDRMGRVVQPLMLSVRHTALATGKEPGSQRSTVIGFKEHGRRLEEDDNQFIEKSLDGRTLREENRWDEFDDLKGVRMNVISPGAKFHAFRRRGELLGYLVSRVPGFDVCDARLEGRGAVHFFFSPDLHTTEALAIHSDDDGNLFLQHWPPPEGDERRVTVYTIRWRD